MKIHWSGLIRRWLCAGLGGWLAAGPVAALDLHVAPNGNDAWSGRLPRPNAARTDGPLATLTGARDALRKLKAGGPLREPVRVLVAEGRYTLTEPLVWEPADSGSPDAPIIYQAAPGARPVFSGGRIIRGFQRGPQGIWQAKLPEVAAGKWYFEQLWVNGRRAVRARSPNQFWFYLADVQEEALEGGRAARQTSPSNALDAAAGLSRHCRSERGGVKRRESGGLSQLGQHPRFIDRVDAEEMALITSGEGMKSWNPWRKDNGYILENYRKALDMPGEWFLGRDGTLSYLPRPGEDMTRAEVVAPVVEKLVILRGDAANGRYVEHLTFRGLTFHHAPMADHRRAALNRRRPRRPLRRFSQADGRAKHPD